MPNVTSTLRVFVALLVGSCALSSGSAAQTPSSVWTIPGIVNVAGLNGTHFVSDLAVTNPGGVPAQASISFVPANGTTPVQVTLNAGETVVYRNLLDRLWSAQGAGATQVASDSPLLIRARTYNTAASGTYGVALPVFADDRLLSPDDTADSLWISQSADGSSGYRTNVAVVFPDAGGGSATVTVYGADGAAIGSQDFSLDSAGFQQFGVGGFAGAVSVARARVRVTRGRAAGYSVVVDNITGDSSLFTFENLPAGWQDVLVNGVARANGRNNTFFRTDGRFYNPSTRDAVVTVSFHASGDSNGAPATRDFTIPAGRILDVTDVLDTLLGIPVGLAGALRFRSISPVGILCRTSNVDPAGIKPGTYGAQQKPAPLLSFLMSADAGAVVTGIRQNAAFRTNVGFAAGEGGVTYSLTLKSTSGATVAAATGSLGAFGWTQPNVADLFPHTTVPDDATLLVKVTSGSVDVFDSSIDNASGDPVVTPIMPLPVDIPPSATIGSQGGSIRSTDGRFTLTVPAGALSTPAAFSVVPIANTAPDGVGAAYEVTPDPIGLSGSGVVLTYLPDDLEGSGASALAVVALDGGTWRNVQRGAVDTVRRSVTVPLAFSAAGTAARSSAERRSLGGQSRAISLVKKLSLTPKREALLTSQSTIFQVRGPASAIAAIRGPAWLANGLSTETGQTTYGTLTPNGTLAGYKAPDKAPAGKGNPVVIEFQFGIEEGNELWGEYYLTSRVRILPRSWTFDATASLGWSCGRIKLCFEALSYKGANSVDFELDETLAVSELNGEEPREIANDLTKCSNFDKNGDEGVVCPGPIAPNKMVPMSIDAFSGKFDKALDRFVLTATFTNAFYDGGRYQNCTRDGVPLSEEPSGGMIGLLLEGFQQQTTSTRRVPPSSEFWLDIPMYSFTDIYTVKGDLSVRK